MGIGCNGFGVPENAVFKDPQRSNDFSFLSSQIVEIFK